MSDEPDTIAHVRHLPIMEQMKYGFARYVWPRRHQQQPNKNPDGERETWQQLWERQFNQKLLDYVEFCKANYERPPGDRHGRQTESRPG